MQKYIEGLIAHAYVEISKRLNLERIVRNAFLSQFGKEPGVDFLQKEVESLLGTKCVPSFLATHLATHDHERQWVESLTK